MLKSSLFVCYCCCTSVLSYWLFYYHDIFPTLNGVIFSVVHWTISKGTLRHIAESTAGEGFYTSDADAAIDTVDDVADNSFGDNSSPCTPQ